LFIVIAVGFLSVASYEPTCRKTSHVDNRLFVIIPGLKKYQQKKTIFISGII